MRFKGHLVAPGPTEVPPDVLLSMARSVPHHRSDDFIPLFEKVREDLKWLFQTKNDVLILASSGTAAMESAVSNFLKRGDKAIVVRGGKFGERWAEILSAYGCHPVNIDVEWGKAVAPSLVEKALKDNPDAKAVYIQASETSTGVKHPVKEIAELVRNRDNTIMVVDAITALGVFDVRTDEWGLDIVVGGSQKALMLPPGLAFISVSDKAWKLSETSDLPRYYLDLKKEKKNQLKAQTAYTPAVSLIVGLSKSLDMLKEEGLENIFKRHRILSKGVREGLKAMGLKLLAEDSPSEAVTAAICPEGIDGQKVVKYLREKFKIIIAGGQDRLKGKIFRIAHIGYYDPFDMILTLSAVEMALKDMGYEISLGNGVKRATEIYWEAMKDGKG
jgi:aspartate aminotransferase-like enzyme